MIKMYDLVTGYCYRNNSPTINGNIDKGNVIAVIGENGTGKTAFLKTIAGLLPPISGKLKFNNINDQYDISYLPQKKNIDRNFPITVFDVVSMGCWPKIGFFKRINYYQKCLIWQALKIVKLINLSNHNINNLSGGQIQCMLFARILVQQSSLILLDEPFQGIDAITCKILMNSIIQFTKNGSTVIIVCHDEIFKFKQNFSKVLLLTHTTSSWKYINNLYINDKNTAN